MAPKCGFQSEIMERKKSWACSLICIIPRVGRCVGAPGWDLKKFYKQEFKIKSTYTIEERRQLLQVEWK
jgi:hypothetical protein